MKRYRKTDKGFSAYVNACPLRIWRLKQRLTQEQLAFTLNINPTMIHSYETGRNMPTVITFNKISNLTGITYEQWLAWKNSKDDYKCTK